MSSERLDDLEARLAFQDDTLHALNEVICKQQDQLDRLQVRYRELREVVEALLERQEPGNLPQQRPPHY
jgi:SlyX protein